MDSIAIPFHRIHQRAADKKFHRRNSTPSEARLRHTTRCDTLPAMNLGGGGRKPPTRRCKGGMEWSAHYIFWLGNLGTTAISSCVYKQGASRVKLTMLQKRNKVQIPIDLIEWLRVCESILHNLLVITFCFRRICQWFIHKRIQTPLFKVISNCTRKIDLPNLSSPSWYYS